MRITDEQVAAMQARVDAAGMLVRLLMLVDQYGLNDADRVAPAVSKLMDAITESKADRAALLSERAEMVEAFRQIIARGHSHTCSFESAMALTCDCAVGIAERMLNGGAK